MSRKRVNPRRVPVSKAAVKAAAGDGIDDAIEACWGCWIMTLRDKHSFGADRLHAVWNRAEEVGARVETPEIANEMIRQVCSWGVPVEVPPNTLRFKAPTAAAVKAARKASFDRSMQIAKIFFSITLHELYGWAQVRLNRIIEEVDKLMGEVAEGRISYKDIIECLRDEGFILEMKR